MEEVVASDCRAAICIELERIEEDCIHSGKAQFNAGERWSAYHYWLGIPSVLLSAIAGVAYIKQQQDLAGALSVVVAVLAALTTFLKPSERAAKHKGSGDQYLALRNDARVFREIKIKFTCDSQSAINGLDGFTNRRNEMNKASPPCARRDFVKARNGINKGEAIHRVDKRGE